MCAILVEMFHNISIYLFLGRGGIWEYQEIIFNAGPQIATLKAFVLTVFFLWSGLQAFLVGIVVPDPEVMPIWAQKRGIEGSYAEICANKVCTSVVGRPYAIG